MHSVTMSGSASARDITAGTQQTRTENEGNRTLVAISKIQSLLC